MNTLSLCVYVLHVEYQYQNINLIMESMYGNCDLILKGRRHEGFSYFIVYIGIYMIFEFPATPPGGPVHCIYTTCHSKSFKRDLSDNLKSFVFLHKYGEHHWRKQERMISSVWLSCLQLLFLLYRKNNTLTIQIFYTYCISKLKMSKSAKHYRLCY